MTDEVNQRVRMPGRLWLVLAVLCFQILANGFVGYVLLDDISSRESHGQRVSGAGMAYFAAYLSLAVAVLLLLCVVLTFRRLPWIRPTVITVQVINIVSGLLTLVGSGAVTAVSGIALGIAVIMVLSREEVRDWYQR